MRFPGALLLLLPLAASAVAVTPQDFAYGMRLITDARAPAYRVELPLDVYRGSVGTDLADVRVFNAHNEVVPYELRRAQAEAAAQRPTVRLPLFPLQGDPGLALDAMRVTIESGGASLNLKASASGKARTTSNAYIVDARGMKEAIAALQLEWSEDAADFAGRLDIAASEDLAAWRSVAQDVPIANLHAGDQRLIERRVEFPATRAKFWRLSWSADDAPFTLLTVLAEPARNEIEARRASLSVEGAAAPEKPNEFSFDLEARLPVDRVNVDLPERNSIASATVLSRTDSKQIWRSVTRHGFYRLDGGHGELRNAPVSIGIDSDRYWLLRFDRAEDIGHGRPRIEVRWSAHELLFVARGQGPFLLAYGSATAKPAQSRIASVLPKLDIATARLSQAFSLGGDSRRAPVPPPFPWKTVVLWTALVLGVGLLGWMAYRLSRQLDDSDRNASH